MFLWVICSELLQTDGIIKQNCTISLDIHTKHAFRDMEMVDHAFVAVS